MDQKEQGQQSINSDVLDEIVATQKKYFMMYINNKSAQFAVNLEADVKNIISNSIEKEINNLISSQIDVETKTIETNIMNKLEGQFKDTLEKQFKKQLEESKTYLDSLIINLENCIDDKLNIILINSNTKQNKIKELENKIKELENKIKELEYKINNINLIVGELDEYFNSLISEKLKEYNNNVIDIINKKISFEHYRNSCNAHELKYDENKNTNLNLENIYSDNNNNDNDNNYNNVNDNNNYKETNYVLGIDTDVSCEKNAIIKEIKNTLREIDEINFNIVDYEQNRMLKQIRMQNTINNNTATKSKSIAQTFKNTILENISSTIYVNKYCSFLLTTMFGFLVVSQFL